MGNSYSQGAGVQASILDKEYRLQVADRAMALNHPAISGGYIGQSAGSGSDTITRTLWGLGAGVAGTISEDGAAPVTDIPSGTVTVQVVRKSLGRSRTDILALFDASGMLRDPSALALDAAQTKMNTLLSMIAIAGATFTQDSTPGSGVALTWAKFQEARDKVVASGEEGPLMAILGHTQWANLSSQMQVGTSLSDAATVKGDEGYNALLARKLGYQGNYFGVDIYTSKRVPTANAGADYRGCMFGPGGIAWADAALLPDPHGFIDSLDGGKLQIEYDRDASRMLKKIYYNFLVGVSKGEDLRGCTITSDF